MGIAAWGYGTGSTTSAYHPFSLTIQGIDHISSIPMQTISVSTSLASNATLEFIIEDAGTIHAEPPGYSDVLFTDHVNEEILFSGVVIGTQIAALPIGRGIAVRCVDYGYFLDRAHLQTTLPGYGYAPIVPIAGAYIQRLCGAGLPAPITSVAQSYPWDEDAEGRVELDFEAGPIPWSTLAYFHADPTWTIGDQLRSRLDEVAEIAISQAVRVPPLIDSDLANRQMVVYVDPERRLNFWWTGRNLGPAPLAVVEATPPGSGCVNVEELSVIRDYTSVQSQVYDSSTATFYSGSTANTNDYSLGGNALPSGRRGPVYLQAHSEPTIRGSFAVIGTVNWRIGQIMEINAPSCGLVD